MSNQSNIVTVLPKHIEKGIERYGGIQDKHLNQLIKNANLEYTAYIFDDSRILLVLPDRTCAFLYPNIETLYNNLDLSVK